MCVCMQAHTHTHTKECARAVRVWRLLSHTVPQREQKGLRREEFPFSRPSAFFFGFVFHSLPLSFSVPLSLSRQQHSPATSTAAFRPSLPLPQSATAALVARAQKAQRVKTLARLSHCASSPSSASFAARGQRYRPGVSVIAPLRRCGRSRAQPAAAVFRLCFPPLSLSLSLCLLSFIVVQYRMLAGSSPEVLCSTGALFSVSDMAAAAA